ncbi:hypothetical protein ACFY8K_13035 [Streptomyces misionensis]|uniref:hypothetical protein n=1 Tax=Streptomyces misionensis TaxID=67331 RepID=UPI0036B47A48
MLDGVVLLRQEPEVVARSEGHGWNARGLIAWLVSAVVALLFTNLPGQFVGPLGDLAGGTDISLPVGLALAAVVYLGLLAVSVLRRTTTANRAFADPDDLITAVRRGLRRLQYRHKVLDGCFAGTGLRRQPPVDRCRWDRCSGVGDGGEQCRGPGDHRTVLGV